MSSSGFETCLAAVSCLRFACRGGRTALLASHAELPLVLQRPVRGPAGQAVVALLTPAGALFDGDAVHVEIDCESGTDVTLTTASATKLNRCEAGAITFRLRARVAAGATFHYVPHELIPFRGTRYRQRIELDLDAGADAALLEVVSPGASDARFEFDSLELATTLRVAGRTAVREHFVVTPHSARQLGGYTHYGSLLVTQPEFPPGGLARLAPGVLGVSQLPSSGSVVKMLGSSAQSVRATLLMALSASEWLMPLLPP